MRNDILEWLDTQPYLDELMQYINLPSRSSNSDEVLIAADFAVKLMRSSGLKNIRSFATEGNPILYGEIGSGKRTVLIYGHYDVQPEGDLSLWHSDPFKAEIRGDKLYGRGSADNKGQHYCHLLALRYLNSHCPEIFDSVKVKLILDGDEERGSFTLPGFLESESDLLQADFVYASDGPSLVSDAPTIVGSVRGIIDFQITIRHTSIDLHSGNFGGIARSATLDLISLLSSMVSSDGQVLVDGFYDSVNTAEPIELSALRGLSDVVNTIISSRAIVPSPVLEGLSHEFQNQMYPTFNINGIRAGEVGSSRRTVIPSEATASVDCRLVPSMDPDETMALIRKHVDSWALGKGIEVEVVFDGAMKPTRSSLLSPWVDFVKRSLKLGFGKDPVLVPRLGGSLPLQSFPEVLGMDVILVPYALPDENNHAPNENLDLPYFRSGVVSTAALIQLLSETNPSEV